MDIALMRLPWNRKSENYCEITLLLLEMLSLLPVHFANIGWRF